MRLGARLFDGAVQVHVSGCTDPRIRNVQARWLDFPVDHEGELDEDDRAVLRDQVTARVHDWLADTADAGCDVDFYACSGLVTTDPPRQSGCSSESGTAGLSSKDS